MIRVLKTPSVIRAAGNGNKIIREYFGRVNSGTSEVSIARMESHQGWEEPGQRPDFNEYTVVLRGTLKVRTLTDDFNVSEGEAVLAPAGEWIQYSTPYPGGAEYVAVCLPAFTPETVHRDGQ